MKLIDWKPYTALGKNPDFPMEFEIVEFLAGQDAPNGTFKKGDVVRSHPILMNTSLFTHWRPIVERRITQIFA